MVVVKPLSLSLPTPIIHPPMKAVVVVVVVVAAFLPLPSFHLATLITPLVTQPGGGVCCPIKPDFSIPFAPWLWIGGGWLLWTEVGH